ncbi:MAG: RNA-binding protein [Acidobacteria bacterium]|nr:RNA-binding protein [Acidobacteriota bacterium]
MSVRLFVAKLPPTTTVADLREHFSQAGPVSEVILPVDRETGKMRGFAFVDVDDKAAADEAIRRFNNATFKGQTISVTEALPRGEKRPGPRPSLSPSRGFPGRRPESGRANSNQDGGLYGDTAEGRPRRRSPGAGGKKGGRKNVSSAPRGPIRERRSGRVQDLAEEDSGFGEIEFDNLATSAPPAGDDTDE